MGVYRKYQLPAECLPLLKAQCDHAGIEFLCTVYLSEDIPVIAPFVQRFKVASFEAGDVGFVEAHARYGKDILISTGMMGDPTVEYRRVLDTLPAPARVQWLHCVSAYPCPLDQANIRGVRTMSGYSDHTHHVRTGAYAVCAGARILEVHFRLADTDPANPDYGTALDPYELGLYVGYVREAEMMLGDGVKRPQACEAEMSRYRVRG